MSKPHIASTETIRLQVDYTQRENNFDTHGAWYPSKNRYSIAADGDYAVVITSKDFMNLCILRNGSNHGLEYMTVSHTTGKYYQTRVYKIPRLRAGDFLEFPNLKDLTLISFVIERISSPHSIPRQESVDVSVIISEPGTYNLGSQIVTLHSGKMTIQTKSSLTSTGIQIPIIKES